ncbi:hypothetical protein AVEN_179161-1 [Araneus ventricosus]|uniref:Uncharacterized protein n=1 Tax=Araneus ventricosus TaxID=182803 RepID=A0A4Y2HMF4_ARAVE|nr:hypothetical protein AVEN_179161-1 [Araneus ventricosus]
MKSIGVRSSNDAYVGRERGIHHYLFVLTNCLPEFHEDSDLCYNSTVVVLHPAGSTILLSQILFDMCYNAFLLVEADAILKMKDPINSHVDKLRKPFGM